MSKIQIILLSFVAVMLISYLLFYFVFSIYEVDVRVSKSRIYAGSNDKVEIKVVPINSLGFIAPFRKTTTIFDVTEGAELIQVTKNDSNESIFTFTVSNKPGTVRITAKSDKALLPSLIEIEIAPNLALK